MKISDLIADIVTEATDKFGVIDHENDVIEVRICWSAEQDMFFTGLQRPSQIELDRGEGYNARILEYRTEFSGDHQSLLQALLLLQQDMRAANVYDFQART